MITPFFENDSGVLYCGDCLEVMRTMPDDHADLTVTSPPYDDLRKYEGFSFDFEPIARELYRITKPGGVLVWVVGDSTKDGSESLTSFRQALYFKDVCGFNMYDTMIYHREPLPLTHRRYEQHFEYMFVFSKGIPKVFNPIMEKSNNAGQITAVAYKSATASECANTKLSGKVGKRVETKQNKLKGNVWSYGIGFNQTSCDSIAFQHPAIFPEKLAHDHIYSWSNEGDLVFDPFMGSGTVAKQAIRLKRRWVGSEVSEKYCEISVKRILKETEQLKFEGLPN